MAGSEQSIFWFLLTFWCSVRCEETKCLLSSFPTKYIRNNHYYFDLCFSRFLLKSPFFQITFSPSPSGVKDISTLSAMQLSSFHLSAPLTSSHRSPLHRFSRLLLLRSPSSSPATIIFPPLFHILPPPVSLISSPLIPEEAAHIGFTVILHGKERTEL